MHVVELLPVSFATINVFATQQNIFPFLDLGLEVNIHALDIHFSGNHVIDQVAIGGNVGRQHQGGGQADQKDGGDAGANQQD